MHKAFWITSVHQFRHPGLDRGELHVLSSDSRIQVTGLWQRAARDEPGDVETVQTEQIIQPLLHSVSWSVPDGLMEGNLVERASCVGKSAGGGQATDTHTHPVKTLGFIIYLLPASPCWCSCSLPTCSAECRNSAASTAESVWERGNVRYLHTCRDQKHKWLEDDQTIYWSTEYLPILIVD